jgi:hypothetical protein
LTITGRPGDDLVPDRRGRNGVRLDVHALPDRDLEVGVPGVLVERYALTPAGVAERLRRLVGG